MSNQSAHMAPYGRRNRWLTEIRADDATILELVKTYQRAGGDAVRVLRKSVPGDSVVRTGSRRNFRVSVCDITRTLN